MSSFSTVEVATADAEPPNDIAGAVPDALLFKENSTADMLMAPHVSKSDLHEVSPDAGVVAVLPVACVGGATPVVVGDTCAADDNSNKKKPSRTVRVCVLVSSYEGSDAATKDFDDYVNTPAYWFPPESQGVLMNGKGEVVPTKVTCMSHAGPVAVAAAHAHTDGASSDDNRAVTPTAVVGSTNAAASGTFTAVSPQFADVFGDDTAYKFDTVMVEKKTSYTLIARLVASGKYDCFFNLCDGARDEDRAGVDVVSALEQHGVPFTGARSKYYEWDKLTMKAAARAHGIPTPRCAVIYPHEADTVLDTPHALEAKVASLRFPLLFKHPSGYGSIGMGKQSKCSTMDALREALRPFLQQFQSALIEEFITGDEATVLVCEDARSVDTGGVRVYAPVMCDFGPDAFRHFDMKMETDGVPMGWVPMPPDHPAYGDLVRYSRRAFLAMSNGKGYCRVDWRIRDAAGNFEPQFLEVNPNCGLCYPPTECYGSADYILARDEHNGGGGAAYFMRLQMENAIADARALQPRYFEQFVAAEMGFGLFAARDIAAGELVVDHEVGAGREGTVTAQPAPLAVFTTIAAAQDFTGTCPDIVKAGATAPTAGRIWALNAAATAAVQGATAACEASTASSATSGVPADGAVPLFGVLTGPGALALADLSAPDTGAGNLCFPSTRPTDGSATPNSVCAAASVSFAAARDIRAGERLMLSCESLRKRYAALPLQQQQ